MWEMDALRCKCPGCDRCYVWLSDGPGRQSSTGSGAAAGTARREDDARIVQLNIDMRTCRDEARGYRLELTELSREVMRLQAMMEDWARWYNQ